MQKRAQPRHLAVSTGSMCVCVSLGAGGLGSGGAYGEEASEEKTVEPWGSRVKESMLQMPPAQREGEAGACEPGDRGAAVRSFISGREGSAQAGAVTGEATHCP